MRQKANSFRPDKLQDHTNKGKDRRKEEARRKKGGEEKKKTMVAFLVFK